MSPDAQKEMTYGAVEGVSKPISRLVQGTTVINPELPEDAFRLLDGVAALGCTAFDTAHIYGRERERVIGRWIDERGIRDKVVIIGKGAHPSLDRRRVTPFDIAADIHDSLARIAVDYIDLFLLHRDDRSVPVGPIVEELNRQADAGRIHAFGGSNWTVTRIQEANAYAEAHALRPLVASSPHLSLAEQIEEPWAGCISISGPHEEAQRAWYEATQTPLFPWSSLAGGFFSGRLMRSNTAEHEGSLYLRCYGSDDNFRRIERVEKLAAAKQKTVPQIALAYVLNLPLNAFPLVGCQSPEEFAANRDALTIELSPQEMGWLDLREDGLPVGVPA
jgi:aryl-alcohol dehydrogenase-like predicted oxidoreductase